MQKKEKVRAVDRYVRTAHFPELVDIVEDEGRPHFLLKKNNAVTIEDSFKQGNTVFIPPPIESIPWLMPRAKQCVIQCNSKKSADVRKLDAQLFQDLVSYHKRISDLPSDSYYDFLAAWEMHTYLLEAVEFSPIICLYAIPERGKSRTGKAITHVSFRGVHVESLREAYILRMAEHFQCTFFFDVVNLQKKLEKNGSEDILLHRFERGAKVPRVIFPERGAFRDTVFYKVFGPTIVATNEAIDGILESRAIRINMPESLKNFEIDVKPINALELKERLVAFRARHLGEKLENISKPAMGRLGDILKPIQQIIKLVSPERESSFLKLLSELNEQRMADKADSIEARILVAVSNLEEEVSKGILPTVAVTGFLNQDLPDRLHTDPRTVGRRLKAMGFEKAVTSDGASAMRWNQNLLEKLRLKYGLEM